MVEFLEKIVNEICKEEDIKYTNISKGYITILEKNGKIRFFNGFRLGLNSQISGLIADDKYAMYEVLKYAGLPVIEHVLVWDRDNEKTKLQIDEKIDFLKKFFLENNKHIVLKPNTGYGGNKVFQITEIEQLKPVFEELIEYTNTVIANPFYTIKNEHRLVILDGECRLAFTKTLAEGEWQFNLSKGSSAKKIEEGSLKNKLMDLATKVYNYIGARFISIDIIEDYEGNIYVLELNSGVSMVKYVLQNPDDYELVKNIYRDAIKKILEQ